MNPIQTQDRKPADQQPSGVPIMQKESVQTSDEARDLKSLPTGEEKGSQTTPGPDVVTLAASSGKDSVSHTATPAPQTSQSPDGPVTYTWMKDLSSRVSSLENKAETSKTDKIKADNSGISESSHAYMRQTIPEVRDCDWEHFKNRYPGDTGVCAIEVLLSSSYLDEEIESEQLRRLTPEKKIEVLAARKKSRQRRRGDSGVRRLERVRINSAYVLATLAKITGEKWAEKPHTFLRPFKMFIHYHSHMEAEYVRLQEALATSQEQPSRIAEFLKPLSQEEPGTTGVPARSNAASASAPGASGVEVEGSSQKACEDMACYINFMESQIMPLYTMFDSVDLTKPTKIRYSDLWSLFRIGDLVILKPADKSASESGDQMEQRPSFDTQQYAQDSQATTLEPYVARVCSREPAEPDWDVSDLSKTGSGSGRLHLDEDPDLPKDRHQVGVYYIDHNGDDYKAIYVIANITPFIGERDITALRIYPLRFAKDYQQILQNSQARGDQFHAVISQSSHSNLSYNGWTLTQTGPLDDITRGMNLPGVQFIPSIHVDSDIIVDFREAYKSNPSWKPKFDSWEKQHHVTRNSEDRFAIIRWNHAERTKVEERVSEIVVYQDAVTALEFDRVLDSLGGRFLMDKEDWTSSQLKAGNVPSREDLATLPMRLFAYSLRDRKFILANIRCIKLSSRLDASSTFDKLRISDKHKGLIESVVFDHFVKKEAQKKGSAQHLDISDQDFIRGKGRGLVILLHGAPGVGKTATAEAVAYAHNKPLFPITCGNLGIEPRVVEENLTELFRLASLWDCILLLDEAEIFLSPRAKTDDNLQRNAIVSVFLRILEYYAGVLFLTTNRSGALDEAVKSRVHLSLLYPHLGHEETLSLFKMNIERLAQIEQETATITGRSVMTIEDDGILDFAKKHFDKFTGREDSRWNGRQIRNAFQIAASLARHQHHRQPHRGLYVGADHFAQVEDATLNYDEFRNRTAGKTESEIAAGKKDRGPDLPQPPFATPPASEWHSPLRERSGTGAFRGHEHEASSSHAGRAWPPNPNLHSHSRGGRVMHDGRGGYGGGLAPTWPPSGGPGTSSSIQARGPSYGPQDPARSGGSSDPGWDPLYRGPETGGHPPEDIGGYD